MRERRNERILRRLRRHLARGANKQRSHTGPDGAGDDSFDEGPNGRLASHAHLLARQSVQVAGALLAPFTGVRRLLITLALSTIVAGVAIADEPPVPRDAVLRGTVETNAVREVPELKGARINRMRDESLNGVRVLDQTWQADGSYADVARFYDRAFADALVIERDHAATATGWLVRLDDGTLASVTLRNTQPTTIEIQRVVP